MMRGYNNHTSGYYLSSCILFKTLVLEIEFCLRLQVKPTQLGPIDKASFCLRGQKQRRKIAPSIRPNRVGFT
jgi:hypothetical protein